MKANVWEIEDEWSEPTQAMKSPCMTKKSEDATEVRADMKVAKFTDDQYTTINQSTAGRFDSRVFVNCLQVLRHVPLSPT